MPAASPQTQQAFAQSVPPQGGFSGMPPYFSAPMQGTAQVSLRVAQLHSAHGGSAAFSGLCTGLHRIRATAGQHRIRLLFRGFLAAQSGLCAPFADDLPASCRLRSGRAAGQSQPIRPTVQPAMYAFSPMQSGAPGAAPQAMPGYAAQGGMTLRRPRPLPACSRLPLLPCSRRPREALRSSPCSTCVLRRPSPRVSAPLQRRPAVVRIPLRAFAAGVYPLPVCAFFAGCDSLCVLACVCWDGRHVVPQMFSSVTRLIVSMVYVALCIVTVAMMMQGGRDVLRTRSAGQSAGFHPNQRRAGCGAAASQPPKRRRPRLRLRPPARPRLSGVWKPSWRYGRTTILRKWSVSCSPAGPARRKIPPRRCSCCWPTARRRNTPLRKSPARIRTTAVP